MKRDFIHPFALLPCHDKTGYPGGSAAETTATFTLTADSKGNAVIAAKDADGHQIQGHTEVCEYIRSL